MADCALRESGGFIDDVNWLDQALGWSRYQDPVQPEMDRAGQGLSNGLLGCIDGEEKGTEGDILFDMGMYSVMEEAVNVS